MVYSTKKSALFVEFPIFMFSLLMLAVLLIILHIVVSFGDSSAEKEEIEVMMFGSYFEYHFVDSFVNTRVSEQIREEIIENLGEKNGGVDFTKDDLRVKDVLIHRNRSFVHSFFEVMREDYLDKYSYELDFYREEFILEHGSLAEHLPTELLEVSVSDQYRSEYVLNGYYIYDEQFPNMECLTIQSAQKYFSIEETNFESSIFVVDFYRPSCRTESFNFISEVSS